MGHHYQLKHFSEKEEQNETLTCSDLRRRGFNMQVNNCEFFSIHEPMLSIMQLHEVLRIRRTSTIDTDDHNEQTLIDVSHDVEKKSFQIETFSTVMFLREFSKFRLNDVCGVLP